jgi:hypothetical protein
MNLRCLESQVVIHVYDDCYLGVFCLSKPYAQVLEERGLCYLVQRSSKLYRDSDVIEISSWHGLSIHHSNL